MATAIFQPTSPTNQNQPTMKISNFCVFCPIWITFSIWAENGPKITWYKFKMATATFYSSTKTLHIPSRTIILFRFLFLLFLLFLCFVFFFHHFYDFYYFYIFYIFNFFINFYHFIILFIIFIYDF